MKEDTANKSIVFINSPFIGIGNFLYFIAYAIKRLNTSNLVICYNSDNISGIVSLFKIDLVKKVPEQYDLLLDETCFDEVLNNDNCDFDSLKNILNFNLFDDIKYDFAINNVCVISMRMGNYLYPQYIQTYKTTEKEWLRQVIEKYKIFDKYTVVVISDDIKLAQFYLSDYKDRIIFDKQDELSNLNLLIKAKLIIGSCSTFCFMGHQLNKEKAKMIVDYPYYKYPNPLSFEKNKQDGLYHGSNIIKETKKIAKKPTRIATCTVIKDEQDYLEEWIQHNIKIGFTDIYLFEDFGSYSHKKICDKYKQVHLYHISDLSVSKESQSRQYEAFCKFAILFKDELAWVAFIDIDEFLMFEEGWTLKRLLNEFAYSQAIYVYWKIISADGHIFKTNKPVTESYFTVKEHKKDDGWYHKSIVNLSYPSPFMVSSHEAKGGDNTMHIRTSRIVCYHKAWLNHYFTKSWEEWITQMFCRGDVVAGNRKVCEFFSINNDMVDKQQQLYDELLNTKGKIPKKIHYFWFGGGEINETQRKCIDSWKKYLSDYEIVRWDESNYDVNKNDFTKALYENKKYAFLSDYARSDIMYNQGGLYFDTDTEIIKSLDKNINLTPFFACDHIYKEIQNGLGYAMPPGNFIDKICLKWMKRQDPSKIFSVNTFLTYFFKTWGFHTSDELQKIQNIIIYPSEYFDPKEITEKTIAIHHRTHLW